jgi:hypothetical protein
VRDLESGIPKLFSCTPSLQARQEALSLLTTLLEMRVSWGARRRACWGLRPASRRPPQPTTQARAHGQLLNVEAKQHPPAQDTEGNVAAAEAEAAAVAAAVVAAQAGELGAALVRTAAGSSQFHAKPVITPLAGRSATTTALLVFRPFPCRPGSTRAWACARSCCACWRRC